MTTSQTPAGPARTGTRAGTYFLSLTVENVRCFGPAQRLDLAGPDGRPAQWTIILGENNVGKSTVLQSLAMLDIVDVAIDEEEFLRGFALVERISTLSVQAMFGGAHDWHRNATTKSKLKYQVFGQSVRDARVEVQAQIEFEIDAASVRSKLSGPTLLMRHPICYGYGPTRRTHRSRSTPVEADDPCASLFSDAASLRDPEVWLLTADYNARLHGSDAERFAAFAKRVQDALANILPEVAETRIQAAEEPGGSPRVEARTPDGWVPLRRLGFGYQNQVAWLVDFASRMFERYPDSPDPLAEPAVVLVDEIDLHMHPRWQRQIIGYLTELCPATQFIVTAHSPLVVQAAEGANIMLLRREDDHVVIDNDPEVLRNWRVDQILTSELFGLDSARPPQIEAQLEERRALLAKAKLTSRDRVRLTELEARIGDLPAGESAEDRRAMELIRRAAEKLQSSA